MPKDQRRRVSAHAPSAKVKPIVEAIPIEATTNPIIALPAENAVEEEEEQPELSIPLKKKEKQQLKKDAFLERLGSTQAPYSKSHLRRLKRKARDQLATGLGDMQEALTALQDPSVDDLALTEPATVSPDDKSTDQSKTTGAKPPLARIGEGKGATLSKSQRKRALEMEKLRHPLILANPQFSTNPFETIRTHAQNTLLKHVPPANAS